MLVLVGVWIGLGRFGTAGSQTPPPRADESETHVARRVGVVRAHTRDYARLLIVSARTEANKTVAVTARSLALRLAGDDEAWTLAVVRGAEVVGALIVLSVGVLLAGAALLGGAPAAG